MKRKGPTVQNNEDLKAFSLKEKYHISITKHCSGWETYKGVSKLRLRTEAIYCF